LNPVGVIAYERGDLATARAVFAEEKAIAESVGETNGATVAIANAASVELEAGQFEDAISLASDSLTRYTEIEDAEGIGYSLLVIGWARLRSGDPVGARSGYEEAIRVLSPLGHREFLATALYGLAIALERTADCAKAAHIAAMTKAALLGQEVGDPVRLKFDPAECATLQRLFREAVRLPDGHPPTVEAAAAYALECASHSAATTAAIP
jgi:tetratricopeptide (TPR) repeat protein